MNNDSKNPIRRLQDNQNAQAFESLSKEAVNDLDKKVSFGDSHTFDFADMPSGTKSIPAFAYSRSMNIYTLADFLINSAGKYPDKTAFYFGENHFTYKEILDKSSALASYFIDNGLKKGDRVFIYMDNAPETVISIFGTLLAGGAFSVITPAVKAPKLKFMIENYSPKFIIANQTKIEMLSRMKSYDDIPPLIITGDDTGRFASFDKIISSGNNAPHVNIIDVDLAAVIYTTGSTGEAKGVALTHLNMVSAARSITEYLGTDSSDTILCILPLSFDYGLYQLLISVMVGGTIVLEKQFGYPYQLIQLIETRQVTGLPCVPTMMAIFLHMDKIDTQRLSSVRYITNTGAALPPAFIPRLQAIFKNAKIFSMYGLTECKRVSYLPPELINQRPDSVGIPMPNTEVFIVDEFGNMHERDAAGELVIRGSNVMQGYWNDPEGTSKILKPGRYPWEKILYTGDMFRIDIDGFLYFLGRRDDMIRVRGGRVAPKEIENVLYELNGVVEARVLPVPDELLGSAIKAEIVLRKDMTISVDEILNHCRGFLEERKLPKYINFVKELPKMDNGKISRMA
jgi:long-chain acyl-CoA synthetase